MSLGFMFALHDKRSSCSCHCFTEGKDYQTTQLTDSLSDCKERYTGSPVLFTASGGSELCCSQSLWTHSVCMNAHFYIAECLEGTKENREHYIIAVWVCSVGATWNQWDVRSLYHDMTVFEKFGKIWDTCLCYIHLSPKTSRCFHGARWHGETW